MGMLDDEVVRNDERTSADATAVEADAANAGTDAADNRFDRLMARADAMDARFDALEARLEDTNHLLKGLTRICRFIFDNTRSSDNPANEGTAVSDARPANDDTASDVPTGGGTEENTATGGAVPAGNERGAVDDGAAPRSDDDDDTMDADATTPAAQAITPVTQTPMARATHTTHDPMDDIGPRAVDSPADDPVDRAVLDELDRGFDPHRALSIAHPEQRKA